MNHCLLFNCHCMYFNRPGGPYRIATILRDEGWDVEVAEYLDLWDDYQFETFCEMTITNNTKFIGFSYFFSYWSKKFDTFISHIKKKYPHIQIVVGGQGKPKFKNDNVDYYIHGYGENALLAIAASLSGNTPGGHLKFDANYRVKGMKLLSANTSYPSFPMKSLKIQYEKRDYIEPWEWLTCEFSRGCMFECLYCNFPVLGVKGDYTRDAQDYVDHLQRNYDDWGVTNYYASDETFNDRTEKIIKFADATEKLSFDPFFTGFMRGDLLVARPQDWEHLVRMGMCGHFYGIESMHHPTAKAIGKGMNPEKLRSGLLDVRDYFKTHGNNWYRGCIAIVAGLPHETEETLKEATTWLHNNWKGEAVEMYPLEIPIDEYTEKFSRLAQDWHKWGYRDANEDEYDHVLTGYNVSHSTTNLNWVNDHMSYSYAKELSKDFMDTAAKEGHFSLNPYAFDYSTAYNNTLEQTLNAAHGDIFKRWMDEKQGLSIKRREIFERYINKKLNR